VQDGPPANPTTTTHTGDRVLHLLSAVISVLGARSLAAAAAFLGNVLVARQLGDARFSQFYLLFSIMTIVAGLTGPAIDTSLVRYASKRISKDHDDSLPYFKAVLYLKFAVLLLTAFAWLAATRPILRTMFEWYAEDPQPVRWYYVLLAFTGGAVVSLWGFAQSYFQAHQRFTEYAGYEFFSSLLRLGLVIGLIGLEIRLVLPFLAAYVIAPATMMIISWSQIPSKVFAAHTSITVIRELLHFGKWVLLATIFTTLTQRLDVILINVDRFGIPKDEVGRYSAAVSVVLLGELVLLTFYSVLLPKASAMKEAWELRRFIGQFRIPSLLFCLGLTLTLPLAAPFCHFVLGPQYYGTEAYFGILMMGVVVTIGCAPTVTAMYSLGYSNVVAIVEGLRLFLTLAIGIWITPRYGAWGMAMTMAGVRAVIAILTYLVAHQLVKRASLREFAPDHA
jgi:O-antigen/teichoic acid export membrane protein